MHVHVHVHGRQCSGARRLTKTARKTMARQLSGFCARWVSGAAKRRVQRAKGKGQSSGRPHAMLSPSLSNRAAISLALAPALALALAVALALRPSVHNANASHSCALPYGAWYGLAARACPCPCPRPDALWPWSPAACSSCLFTERRHDEHARRPKTKKKPLIPTSRTAALYPSPTRIHLPLDTTNKTHRTWHHPSSRCPNPNPTPTPSPTQTHKFSSLPRAPACANCIGPRALPSQSH